MFRGKLLIVSKPISLVQAALQPVSSAEKLDLVEQLTGYVSDALAEVLISLERARRPDL